MSHKRTLYLWILWLTWQNLLTSVFSNWHREKGLFKLLFWPLYLQQLAQCHKSDYQGIPLSFVWRKSVKNGEFDLRTCLIGNYLNYTIEFYTVLIWHGIQVMKKKTELRSEIFGDQTLASFDFSYCITLVMKPWPFGWLTLGSG